MAKKTIAQVVVVVIGGLNTAVPLILDAQTVFPAWPWQYHALIGFIVFAGMMIWMVSEAKNDLNKIKIAIPNIVLKSIDKSFQGKAVNLQYSHVLSQVLIGSTETPNFTRIWVANNPNKPIQSVDAEKLYCEITFFNSECKRMFTMSGRWAESKEVIEGAQPMEMDQMTLLPNNRPFCMDIGLKYIDEEYFYGYNGETPRKNTKGFRDNDRCLPKGNYYVKTEFTCKGVDKIFWFKLINMGIGQHVDFIETTVQPPALYI